MDATQERVCKLAAPLALDPAYLEFVCRLPRREQYAYGANEWTALDVESLDKPYRIGRGTTFSSARAGAAHAELLRNLGVDVSDMSESKEAAFGVDRLARGFCIGLDNGAPLFIESDSGGVFVYHGDGMYVERWATTVVELLSGSRRCEA
jgi:hypothetical protein